MRFLGCGKSASSRNVLRHTRQLLVKASHVKSKRKSRAHKCSRGSIAIVSRLLDVGHHFSRIARCARRTQAIAAENSLRDARFIAFPGATPAVTTIRMVKR